VGKIPLPVARGGSSSASRAPNPKSSPSTGPRLGEDTVLLVAAKTVKGRPATWRRLGRTVTAMASGGAPAMRTVATATEGAGASPPSDGWVRKASMRWLDGGGRAWQWCLGVTSIGTGKAPFDRGWEFV
jgi:hypothetical protein